MNESVPGPSGPLPLASEREIDAACLRFEAAWQAGQRPRIEEYLGQTQEPTRSALLAELLRLDLEYRRRNGEAPAGHEYATRSEGEPGEVGGQAFGGPPGGTLPQVPGYKVLAEIGRGGMGVVYKAWQVKADRLVALKMVLAGEMASSGEMDRFAAEARAAAGLNHPNVVTIYEVGEHAGRQYFTMELVAGGNLAEQVAHSPLPSRRAAEVVLAVAGAVHYAHVGHVGRLAPHVLPQLPDDRVGGGGRLRLGGADLAGADRHAEHVGAEGLHHALAHAVGPGHQRQGGLEARPLATGGHTGRQRGARRGAAAGAAQPV